MATFQKRGKAWQCQIRRKGFPPQSRTFTTKLDAQTWARQIESEIDRGVFILRTSAEKTLLREVLERYKNENFPRLARGGKSQMANLRHLDEHLGHLSLAALDSSHVAQYRDKRSQDGVSSQTIKHELGLLNRVLKACQIDWNIPLPRGLATALVRKPSLPLGRDRRLQPGEESKLLKSASEYGGQIGLIIQFSLETAMRRGEIEKMRWDHLDFKKHVLAVPETKTKTPRKLPLSKAAIAILTALPRRIDGKVWDMALDSITGAFVRVCARAGIQDLRFHDLRHEATSRFFEKNLNMMQVAAITGHKTLSMLKRYTHLRAEDLVEALG